VPVQPPIVCSFHTPDAYYREHGDRLRASLDRLGLDHDVRQIEKAPDQDWADVCRQKIAFLAEVCEAHPDRAVFWIDADCSLLSMPEWVRSFSADLVGFQRGFGSPLAIGYARRTRFWEPCFFGISPSTEGRRFIADAARLEAASDVKATDDYFFEEAWRANAHRLSFQVIPSSAVVSPETIVSDASRPFFAFGSSGHVAEFKDKVAQHGSVGGPRRQSVASRVRRAGLAAAKRAERALPAPTARTLRRAADAAGVTSVLTGGAFAGQASDPAAPSPARRALIETTVARAQRGESAAYEESRRAVETGSVPTDKERFALRAASAFHHHATTGHGSPIALAWWPRPFPGNFGDWLSPLIVGHATGRPLRFQAPTAKAAEPHLMALGSIARFAKRSSTVVGTGVSTLDVELAAKARWVSVRGPLTAQALRNSGGPDVDRFGDPGVLVRRAVPLERGATNGRVALVRHYAHLPVPVQLSDDMDEFSVLAAHPDELTSLLSSLVRYDRVVTSAMHVMIACHSYGIPCALVTFEGVEDAVPGSGVKYEDYALGVGIRGLRGPNPVPADLRGVALDALTLDIRLDDAVLDQVATAMRDALAPVERFPAI